MASESDSEASFKLTEGKGYLMDRDHAAACRLNYQHYLWKDNLGFMVDPSIKLAPDSCVADVATGTGLWLIDVARQLPQGTLHGFDVTLKNVPHPGWLPNNITFRHWDIFTEVPEDMVAKYDLVHVRLLILALDGENAARPVIRKLLKMLKPGGYLQWDELDVVNTSLKYPEPSNPPSAPGFDGLFKKSRAGGLFDWSVHLPDFIAEGGFQDAHMESYGDRNDLVRAFNDQHLMTMEEFATGLSRIGKTEAAAEFYQNIRDAYEESTMAGAAICFPRVVVVARKPL